MAESADQLSNTLRNPDTQTPRVERPSDEAIVQAVQTLDQFQRWFMQAFESGGNPKIPEGMSPDVLRVLYEFRHPEGDTSKPRDFMEMLAHAEKKAQGEVSLETEFKETTDKLVLGFLAKVAERDEESKVDESQAPPEPKKNIFGKVSEVDMVKWHAEQIKHRFYTWPDKGDEPDILHADGTDILREQTIFYDREGNPFTLTGYDLRLKLSGNTKRETHIHCDFDPVTNDMTYMRIDWNNIQPNELYALIRKRQQEHTDSKTGSLPTFIENFLIDMPHIQGQHRDHLLEYPSLFTIDVDMKTMKISLDQSLSAALFGYSDDPSDWRRNDKASAYTVFDYNALTDRFEKNESQTKNGFGGGWETSVPQMPASISHETFTGLIGGITDIISSQTASIDHPQM